MISGFGKGYHIQTWACPPASEWCTSAPGCGHRLQRSAWWRDSSSLNNQDQKPDLSDCFPSHPCLSPIPSLPPLSSSGHVSLNCKWNPITLVPLLRLNIPDSSRAGLTLGKLFKTVTERLQQDNERARRDAVGPSLSNYPRGVSVRSHWLSGRKLPVNLAKEAGWLLTHDCGFLSEFWGGCERHSAVKVQSGRAVTWCWSLLWLMLRSHFYRLL